MSVDELFKTEVALMGQVSIYAPVRYPPGESQEGK